MKMNRFLIAIFLISLAMSSRSQDSSCYVDINWLKLKLSKATESHVDSGWIIPGKIRYMDLYVVDSLTKKLLNVFASLSESDKWHSYIVQYYFENGNLVLVSKYKEKGSSHSHYDSESYCYLQGCPKHGHLETNVLQKAYYQRQADLY